MGKIIRLIFLFCSPNLLFSQAIISGTIKDDNKNAIPSVSVILKDSLSISTITYTYTDDIGYYSIKSNRLGKLHLIFTSLGFENDTILLKVNTRKQHIKRDVILKTKAMQLNSVILRSENPITVTKDTINFKTKYFADGTEQTVEELLQKIPGLQIDNEGTIKIGNQEIEKLMVDGDDFFEKGYKILSKNMPAYPIEEVEVLKNYSNNRLLKGIEESNRVAINLKLDEESKRIWFGNAEASIGNDNFHQLKINLMNFGNKNKYYFLTNFNNTGINATGHLESLIRPFRLNEPASIGDNQSLNSLISLEPYGLGFSKNRNTFNNTKMASFNAIFNPKEKLKIKTLGFLNLDRNDFYRNSIDNVHVEGANFTNIEDYELRNKKRIGFGKLDILHEISKTKTLEAITKYNSGDFNDASQLVFNSKSTIENLQHQNQLFDQKISYTNKFKNKKVFLLTGRFINEKAPQNYAINQFFFQDLFPGIQDANKVSQLIKNKMQFAGAEAHLLDRKKNGDLLELKLGNEFRRDKISTELSILEENTILEQPNGYQNHTNYLVNNLYLKSKYRLKVKDIGITGQLNLHQLYNRLKNNEQLTQQNKLFATPNLGFDWKINSKNKITTSYSYSFTNAEVLDIYSDFILKGYRSFSKGMGDMNQLNTSSVIFNYQLGNWSDRFFANTNIIYNKNHDFFSTNSTINQNYTQSEKILVKDRQLLVLNTNLDYFIKFLFSNLKLDFGYSESDYKNIINNSDWREISSINYNYGLELRSGFKGVFNFHIGTKWSTTKIRTAVNNSFTDNKSFLDLTFVFNPKLNFDLQSERYAFRNLDSDNTYYFLDFNARYKLIDNKLTLGVIGKNIFNTSNFKTSSISDIGSSTTEYRLLPRHILLKIEYRF